MGKAPMIDNPDYKGPWEHPMIPNKDYAPETYAKYKDLTTVGFELWTVNGGSIFDNILVTAEKKWKKIKGEEGGGEKEAKEAWKKENEPEEEEPDDDEDDDEEEEHDEL